MRRSQQTAVWRLLLVMIALALLAAGCRVKMDVAAQVSEDGSGEVAVTVLLGQTVREALSEGGLVTDDSEELKRILEAEGADALRAPDGPDPIEVLEDDVPAGWIHERIRDEDNERIQGVVLRARFATLEELPELLASLSSWGADVAAKAGGDVAQVGVGALTQGMSLTRDGSLFRFRAQPNVEAYEGATGGPNSLRAEFSISLALPGGIREHDADEVNGGTLVWHIPPGASRSISAVSDLEYDSGGGGLPMGLLLAGAVAAGLAGVVGFRHLRGREDDGEDDPPEFPGVPDEAPIPV